MDTLISRQLQTASSLSFSSDLVRAMHASGSREMREIRASPVSCHQSRAWPFACLAFCSTDYRKKRDCSQSRTALLMATFTKPCFSQLHTNSVFLHYRKQPAQVANAPLTSQGCPLMMASTVFPIVGTSLKEKHVVLY